MARGKCVFRQSDLTRAFKAARAAGVEVARYEIAKDGRIIVVPVGAENVSNRADNEVEKWLAKHAHRN
jgi:hypothetical protein